MKEIMLKEIFTEEEFYQFQKATNDPRDSSVFPHRNTLIDKVKIKHLLYKIIKEKLYQLNENYLIAALNWLEKESTTTTSTPLVNKSNSSEDIIKLKNEFESMKGLIQFIDEYTTIKWNANGRNIMRLTSSNSKELTWDKIKEFAREYEAEQTRIVQSYQVDEYLHFSEDSINKIETPCFDIFKLEDEVGADNTLSVISCYIFASHGWYSILKYNKFENFIKAITHGYLRDNPYHNDLHAADVAQTCMVYLKLANFKSFMKMTELDYCASFWACIVHDYRHPGYTNNLWIRLNNPIAIRYNDTNVLESYHISQTFKWINSNEDYNIFSMLSPDNYRTIRKQMIAYVLATDMTFHNAQLDYLKNKISEYGISKGENRDKIVDSVEKGDVELSVVKMKMLEIAIHACDISNPTKPFDIYSNWAERVVNEFWRQGDFEKSLGWQVSMNCDRLTTTKAQCQVGFMVFIVQPFFRSFVEIFNELAFLSDNVKENTELFKKLREKESKKHEGN